ncbi:hypothetical protein CDD82_6927 [Ophiocordyceps australis]|uniref:RNA-dependent RNA polymerase n=1 Tax=Ophiocordyceps australis TaxID=1399860 RepID=A0A2C5YTC6_9HYPO|nr:hypothetical protein CDD82_6927 [Ophiocordyceps australis]
MSSARILGQHLAADMKPINHNHDAAAHDSMEVFIRGFPVNLGERGLSRELEPFIKALNIQDWICVIPKNKTFGFINFVYWSDGQKFLDKFASRPPPKPQPGSQESSTKPYKLPPIPRLHILQHALHVSLSHRTARENTQSHLEFERNSRNKPKGRIRAPPTQCRINGIACGKNVFAGDQETLSFVQQSTMALASSWIKPGPKNLTVMLDDDIRMDVPYDIIEHLVAEPRGNSIILVLRETPRFYKKARPTESNSIVKWTRMLSLVNWHDHDRYVSHCLVYRFDTFAGHEELIHRLKHENLLSMAFHTLPIITTPQPIIHDYTSAMAVFEGKLQDAKLPFPILFQIQTLVWNNYLHPCSAVQFLEKVISESQDAKWILKGLPITTASIKKLFSSIPHLYPGIGPSELNPLNLVQEAIDHEINLGAHGPQRSGPYGFKPPERQAWVFKALVMPTRITLSGPDAESKNRVLRMFPHHTDYFLRVSFVEENGQDLGLNARVSNDVVFKRYREVLRHGIRIAGRKYSFLGFSHSSLRAHSTWFMAPFIDHDGKRQTKETVLNTLGDFRGIRVPAKCAARIGQAFSETPWSVNIVKTGIQTRQIPDIKSADGTRVFSDGVGSMSRGALDVLRAALPMRASAPTCFQIRWGGVKGMLALDSRLPGKVICVREESMNKFPSKDRLEIGICDVASRPLRLVLNRQIIKILEDMGVDDAWFFALQERALKQLRGVTATAANTTTFLRYQDIGSPLGLPSFFSQLHKMGIDYRDDDFLRSVVEHVVLRELRLLKHKARIPVGKGVTLFGIMDETGWLQENQIYVTYDKKHLKSGCPMDATLVDGPVLVTRCPALHPGDVQYVEMKTPPDGHPLRQLRNCVVFSQHGQRDLPSQLSGGDLDGDLYNIIWDVGARPKYCFLPADYPLTSPRPLDRDVTTDDIADFFINFMKTDILGIIASRHQVVADVELLGTRAEACIKLASLHSTAVDYSKTGTPVLLSDLPRGPRTRPDFMAPAPPLELYERGQIDHIGEADEYDDDDGLGRNKPRYHLSEKILGQLYRGVDEKMVWDHDVRRRKNDSKGSSIWEQFQARVMAEFAAYNVGPDPMAHMKQAWKIRTLYDEATTDSMWRFSDHPRKPISEVEYFCGSVLSKEGAQTRRQRDSSIRLKEETERIMSWISGLMRRTGSNSGDQDEETEAAVSVAWRTETLQLCWACFLVGCMQGDEEASKASHGSKVKLQGFRVVAATCVLRELIALRSDLNTLTMGGGFVGVRGREVAAPPTKEDRLSAKGKEDSFYGLVPTVALLSLHEG